MNLDTIHVNDFFIKENSAFEKKALAVFRYQYEQNELFRSYVQAIKTDIEKVDGIHKIPFLPISFFKSHTIISGVFEPEIVFESSKTTGEISSKHWVRSKTMYHESALLGFEEHYGSIKDYTILALLPSYLERSNASLVSMVSYFMQQSGQGFDGFYLHDFKGLFDRLQLLIKGNKKVILIGVSFALMDFAEQYPADFSKLVVMETGGMKGRKKEITRMELHAFLKQQWNLEAVHAEYGMTELLSQAYAQSNGSFKTCASLRVLVRDVNDPFDIKKEGVGALNFIDLSNQFTCSFIATEDIGKVYDIQSFEVFGRVDHSALRGCSLLLLNQ
jgi:hypothetical protein